MTDRTQPNRTLLLAGLFAAELVALVAAYQLVARFDCAASGAFDACRLLRGLAGRAISVVGVAALLVWAWPQVFARLAAAGGGRAWRRPAPWPWLHAAGVAMLFLPLALAGSADFSAGFARALLPWLAGAAAAATGGLFWVAPPAAWAGLGWREGRVILAALVLALLLPDLAALAAPLWDLGPLTSATFAAVVGLLRLAGARPDVVLDELVIGVDDFYVQIAHACSGVEGLALVTAFSALYAILFRDAIRPLRFALTVLPLALAASWVFNVVRIAALIGLGARVSSDLAVEGFHSFAGWLFFTLLAFAIMAGVHATPWLHRLPAVAGAAGRPAGPGPGLRADPLAAQILPFVAFMLAGVATGAFFAPAELGYPVVAAVLALALALFWPAIRALPWRLDPVAVVAGAGVGGLWSALAPTAGDPALAAALAALPASAVAAWVAARLAGTVLLVPLVEELFFRGYLLARLAGGGGPGRQALAVAVSTALFAALHGRWLAGALAGLVFAAVMLRRERVSDAIVAHMVANAAVGAVALARGDWSLI